MKFLFACGGTAGHINPALAIAAELLRSDRESDFLFVGAGRELENRLIPSAGYKLVNIRMSGLKRGVSPADLVYNLKTVRNLTAANKQAAKIIRGFEPDAVIGTGGYICYPVLRAASKMRIPGFIHESNAVPGLTTKLLNPYVDKVFVSFPGLEGSYRRPDKVIFTGTPVREGFGAPVPESEGPEVVRKPLVLSFWGSLGAEHMNEVMEEFIKLNVERGLFDHIHVTGKGSDTGLTKILAEGSGVSGQLPPGIDIREYIDDMPSVMPVADIVMCRAGGSTIAELSAAGKPAVLIPSPYVTNNQQEENAKHVRMAGGAVVIHEKDCTGGMLFDVVSSILQDREKLESMSSAQKALRAPGAASNIAGIVTQACRRRRSDPGNKQ